MNSSIPFGAYFVFFFFVYYYYANLWILNFCFRFQKCCHSKMKISHLFLDNLYARHDDNDHRNEINFHTYGKYGRFGVVGLFFSVGGNVFYFLIKNLIFGLTTGCNDLLAFRRDYI